MSETFVNLKKAGMASRNIVIKKPIHVLMISFAVVSSSAIANHDVIITIRD